MIKKYEWMIAWRYLRSKQKEGFISVISAFSLAGIALGVATLIIVMSVMNGYEVELIKRIVGINGHLSINKRSSDITDYNQYVNEIRGVPGVAFAAPMIMGQGMLSADKFSSGVMVRGMSESDVMEKPMLSGSIKAGSFYHDNANEVVIGSILARKMGVSLGDKVKLISASSEVTILGTMPRIKTYEVVGIFDVGMYEYNASTIFMPLSQAQNYFDHPDAVTDIEIVLTHPKFAAAVQDHLSELRDDEMMVTDFSQSNDQLVAALRVERNVMFLILTMIVVVAAFNIISSLIMLVKDKTKSIAILRTMGISQVSILKIFIMCGSCIGVSGAVLGGIIGVLFSVNVERMRAVLESMSGVTLFDPVIYYLTKLPSELEISNVIVVLIISVLLSFMATIYPAWRAAKLMPAQALRYE